MGTYIHNLVTFGWLNILIHNLVMYCSCELYFDAWKLIICDCAQCSFFREERWWQNKLSPDISGKEVVDTFCDMWVAIDIYDLHVVDCIYNNGGSEVIPYWWHMPVIILSIILRFLNIVLLVLFYKIFFLRVLTYQKLYPS